MPAVIEVADLTNGSVVNQEWSGTGVFDTLMAAVNKNIELQYQKGRITGNDYSTVYLGAMQAVLGQSIEFLLRRDLTEAQIDDVRKGIEVKEAQISNMVDDNLTAAKQRTLLDTQEEAEQYKTTYILPKELAKLEKEIDVAERRMDVEEEKLVDDLLTSAKQREVLDNDVEIKAETRKLTYAERIIKDKEAALLGLDNVVKQSEASRAADPTFLYVPRYEVA
jgi:hypothetical protein